jgi:Peptidase family C25/Propeptide_C25/Peptidase family C25, C terminal ig-like domain
MLLWYNRTPLKALFLRRSLRHKSTGVASMLAKRIKWILLAVAAMFVLVWVGCEAASETGNGSGEFSNEAVDFSRPQVVSMSTEELTIRVRPRLPEIERIVTEQGEFDVLRFGDLATMGEIGAPAIPAWGQLFAIPDGAEVSVEINEGAVTTMNDIRLFPVQEPAPDAIGLPDPVFAFNAAAYDENRWLPESQVDLERTKILRGLKVGNLWISPVRYNAAAQVLEVVNELEVTLRFTGGTGSFFSDPALRTPGYDRIVNRFAINAAIIEPQNGTFDVDAPGADYVIISAPLFLDAAKQLARWKAQCGFKTQVVTTDMTGTTAKQIREWIANAYSTWETPPAYILFFGDAEFIPTHYKTFHTAHYSMLGTDLYYGCVDGDDEFADIALGRISVDTAEQAERRVEQIISYQRDPVDDPDFYTTSFHFGYYQDSDGNREADRRFALTSEEMYQWFSNVMEDSTINPNRCYFADRGVFPKTWNDTSYYWFADWWTLDTKNIPDELRKGQGFKWNCDADQVTSAINAGTFFVTHRDHGGSSGWGEPDYRTDDAQALNNGAKLPVLWTVNCQTGWFDNETDSIVNRTKFNEIHFTEAWERNPNGGAAGIIGSTRISYSGYNDRLVWGWLDGLWPGYIPTYPETKQDATQIASADLLNYGKIYLTTVYRDGVTRLYELEEFHWFGDPAMRMWTQAPAELTVTHPAGYVIGANRFEVEVELDGALVTLMNDGELIARTVSSDGMAVFNFDQPLLGVETFTLTVTADNHRPYVTLVEGVDCNEEIDCQDGLFCNGEEQCDAGKCVEGEPVECDDGLFCNGVEDCDLDQDKCVSLGEPCGIDEGCDEEEDICEEDDDEDDDSASGCGC